LSRAEGVTPSVPGIGCRIVFAENRFPLFRTMLYRQSGALEAAEDPVFACRRVVFPHAPDRTIGRIGYGAADWDRPGRIERIR